MDRLTGKVVVTLAPTLVVVVVPTLGCVCDHLWVKWILGFPLYLSPQHYVWVP